MAARTHHQPEIDAWKTKTLPPVQRGSFWSQKRSKVADCLTKGQYQQKARNKVSKAPSRWLIAPREKLPCKSVITRGPYFRQFSADQRSAQEEAACSVEFDSEVAPFETGQDREADSGVQKADEFGWDSPDEKEGSESCKEANCDEFWHVWLYT